MEPVPADCAKVREQAASQQPQIKDSIDQRRCRMESFMEFAWLPGEDYRTRSRAIRGQWLARAATWRDCLRLPSCSTDPVGLIDKRRTIGCRHPSTAWNV